MTRYVAVTPHYYIASGLENFERVRALKRVLDEAGWRHTYDWTVHGSVQREPGRLAEVAKYEVSGVFRADVVIVLLPGGRGTHVELGIALGTAATVEPTPRIVIYTPASEEDFGTGGKTCVFYHHPLVEKFSDYDAMIASLLKGAQ